MTSVTLNFNDLDGIHGRYKTVPRPVPYIPGMEVLGVVEDCGTGTEGWLGRRVVAIPSGAFGGYAEYVVAPGRRVGTPARVVRELLTRRRLPCLRRRPRGVQAPEWFNFPTHRDGEQLHAELLGLFAAGKLRAIVGQEVPFRDLPGALDAMEQRRTVDRTVVRLS